MNLLDILGRRRQAGADRPDRLVGHDQIGARSRRPAASRRAGRRRPPASGRHRAAPASRRCRRSPRGPRARRLPPSAGPAHRSSPWSARRSEWPTMMAPRRHRPAFRPRCRRYGRPRPWGGSPGPRPRPWPRALLGEAGDQGRRRADQQVGLAGQRARAAEHGVEFGQRRPSGRSFSSCRRSAAGWRRSCQIPAKCQASCRCASRAVAAASSTTAMAVNPASIGTAGARLRARRRHFMMSLSTR